MLNLRLQLGYVHTLPSAEVFSILTIVLLLCLPHQMKEATEAGVSSSEA